MRHPSIATLKRVVNPHVVAIALLTVSLWFTLSHSAGGARGATSLRQWVNISPSGVSTDFNNPANNYGFTPIVMDPTHPKTLYVGTNYQGIWKTTDGGATWAKIDTGQGAAQIDGGRNWALTIDPVTPQVLYTTAGYGANGLWKSTDGGVNWTDMLPGSSATEQRIGTSDVYHVDVDPSNHNHILVSFHYFWNPNQNSTPGILESYDAGVTWTVHNPPVDWGTGQYALFLDNSNTWLVGSQDTGANGGWWRTSNGGQSFTHVSTVSMSHGTANAYRAANGVLYVPANGAILRSTDDGQTWTSITMPEDGYFYSVMGDGNYMYTGAATTGRFVKPTVRFVVSPESNGTHWTAMNSQMFTDGPLAMVYDSVNHIIYSSNELAGVWKLQTSARGRKKAVRP